MNRPRPALARTLAARRAAVALVGVLLAVTACSSDGEQLTKADLERAMPSAEDIGPGFERDREGEEDESNDTQLDVPDECKALLDDDADKEKERAKREFKAADNRELDVSATVTDRSLDEVKEAAQACEEVPFSNGSAEGVITFDVTSSDDFGQEAVVVDLQLKLSAPIELTVDGRGILAKRGDVGMSVLGFGGVDDEGNVTPMENDVVERVARELDEQVEDL